MAQTLTAIQKEEIIALRNNNKSIREVAAQLGHSRNTVRRVLRAGKPDCLPEKVVTEDPVKPSMDKIDFIFLEKLFEQGSHTVENLNFQTHIKSIALQIANEIGIVSVIDQMRLEMAMVEFINYRRFYLLSLSATQQSYTGPLSKVYEKQNRVVSQWIKEYQRSCKNWSDAMRELEIKYGKRFNDKSKHIFVQTNIQNNGGAIEKSR